MCNNMIPCVYGPQKYLVQREGVIFVSNQSGRNTLPSPLLWRRNPPPLDYVFDQWSILLLKVMAWAQELTDLYRVFCEQENQSITIWKIEVYIVVEFPTMKIIIILFPFNMNSLIVFLNLEKSAKVHFL